MFILTIKVGSGLNQIFLFMSTVLSLELDYSSYTKFLLPEVFHFYVRFDFAVR